MLPSSFGLKAHLVTYSSIERSLGGDQSITQNHWTLFSLSDFWLSYYTRNYVFTYRIFPLLGSSVVNFSDVFKDEKESL